jgi:hypothetical protein
MDVQELANNIRADLITEIIPWLRAPSSWMTPTGIAYQSLRSHGSLISQQTLFTCATIVERNCFEWAFANYFPRRRTFKDRLYMRFASAAAASLVTELAWKRNTGLSGLVLRPALAGAVGVVTVFWESPSDDTAAFLRETFQARDWYRELNDRIQFEPLLLAAHSLVQALTAPRMVGHPDE